MYTKEIQTRKKKKRNSKKLNDNRYRQFIDFIADRHQGMCQMCEMNMMEDMHHTKYGAYGAFKDDRSLIGVCRKCHDLCHRDREYNEKAKLKAKDNWDAFKEI